MKTPDCEVCYGCMHVGTFKCCKAVSNSIDLVKQLEAENARLKRELGSAVMALATCAMDGLEGNICKYCTHKYCDEMDLYYECFEWRGVCEENSGKEEQHD